MMYSEKQLLITTPIGSATEFNSIIAGNSSKNKEHAGINVSPENSSPSETTIGFADSSTADAPTTVSKATVSSIRERYELMEAYANDPPLKVEPAHFKRILLWNEV